MASFFSHPAFPVGIALSRISRNFSKPLLVLCCILTLLPDADVISFRFGVPYESQWGHRGFTHSIVFALIIGIFCLPFTRKLRSTPLVVFFSTFLSTLSHGVFDALTDGGLGVAFFWPLSDERYFFPLRPVEVSPIGVRGFLSWRGLVVVGSEILYIWLPSLFLSFIVRKRMTRQ
ncbi:MAG: metal-dependent hydrolase [Bacteriovoracia bacterium]